MTDEQQQNDSTQASDDSFDALLKKAAHVSGPKVASLGVQLHPGSTLLDGRLKIQRRIGEGGMGVVYAAFDEQRRGTVALKTLNRLDAANVYRLKNEFRSLADVSHPNLCHLHELFGDAGQWFFTMELIDGERFDQHVRPDGVLSEQRLRAVLPQLIDGIDAIHQAGKLHRDLKPSNVLVTRDGRVVILDFGLAMDSELGGVGHTVRETSVSGTPGYMAPEQAAGQPATTASDYYALGAMLFEALAGKLPFDGRVHEMLVDKQRNDAPSASSISQDIPVDLDALCAQLLSRDATTRPDAKRARAQLRLDAPSAHAPLRTLSDAPQPATELLGRDSELQALRDAYAQALAGTSTIVWVSGESGMGKSALCEVFLNELRAQGQATVLAGRCYERENVPFKAFDAVVDEISRYLRRLDEKNAAALLPREVFALARVFPVLDRVSVVADSPRKEVPDPNDLIRRAFEAFGELMARMRDRAPLVVFIDDLQWMDQDSVRFMRALFVQPDPVPALLVCAHRSEGAADNALLQAVKQAAADNSGIAVRALNVGPLSTDAMEVLAQRLVAEGNDRSIAATFAIESRGNPFFAKELARAATLHGALPSLADALALHIESLPVDAQRLLSVLALAGQPLSASIAVEACGAAQGFDQLDVLRNEQLIRLSLKGNDRFVECYHDRIREQLVSTMDSLRTRELASALSRCLLNVTTPDHDLLARCLDLGGLPEQAAQHAALAAAEAYAALAFDHAAMLYTQALERGRFDAERTHALRVARADALALAGRGLDAGAGYLEAAQNAQGQGRQALTMKAGEQYLLCGELTRGRALLGEALTSVGHAMPRSLPAVLASIAWSRGRLRLRGLGFSPRDHHDDATLRELEALRIATHCLVRTDQVRSADFSARWVTKALDAGHAVEAARALAWEILITANMGGSPQRIAELDDFCRHLCETTNDPSATAWREYALGIHEVMWLVRPQAGLERLERARAVFLARPVATARYDLPWFDAITALGLTFLGRFTDLDALLPSALEDALARHDRSVGVVLLQQAMFTALARGRVDQAIAVREQATTLISTISTEMTLPEFFIAAVLGFPELYQGDALGAWRANEARVTSLLQSTLARFFMRGAIESVLCGVIVAAANQTSDIAERRHLIDLAKTYAKRARASAQAAPMGVPEAAIACLRGDRAGAIAAMRNYLALPLPPLNQRLAQRRLGALMRDAEGQRLVAEADAAMKTDGMVDPARFADTMFAGIEILQAKR